MPRCAIQLVHVKKIELELLHASWRDGRGARAMMPRGPNLFNLVAANIAIGHNLCARTSTCAAALHLTAVTADCTRTKIFCEAWFEARRVHVRMQFVS